MRCIVSLALLVAALVGGRPVEAAPAEQATCRFQLGFATLRDLVGAERVGGCLEDEHHNPGNGDGLQRTTGGLLVWRKADNFTAFTDGHRSWVAGPYGLQQRLNTERFAWERATPPAGPAAGGTLYVANEATGTVSVVDAAAGTIVATICLGSDPAIQGTPQPAGPCNAEAQHHAPLYNGHVDPHGLWLTPDGSTLLVASRISGTVVAVDTATRDVLGYAPVGREPHLATVRPGGREAWVAVRGESHVDVLQVDRATLRRAGVRRSERLPKVATIDTARGPSMVSFTSDGRSAFVAAGKEARVDKIDAEARRVVQSRAVAAPFTPFGLVSPDDAELYLVHKAAGTLSVLRTADLAPLVEGMPIGPRANHLWFLGRLAYVTIGGPAPSQDNADPEGKVVVVDRASHRIVHELTGPAWTGEPHGIWATPDGRRLFVGHERGNRITIVDTGAADDPADDRVVGTVTGTVEQRAFLKKPIDLVLAP